MEFNAKGISLISYITAALILSGCNGSNSDYSSTASESTPLSSSRVISDQPVIDEALLGSWSTHPCEAGDTLHIMPEGDTMPEWEQGTSTGFVTTYSPDGQVFATYTRYSGPDCSGEVEKISTFTYDYTLGEQMHTADGFTVRRITSNATSFRYQILSQQEIDQRADAFLAHCGYIPVTGEILDDRKCDIEPRWSAPYDYQLEQIYLVSGNTLYLNQADWVESFMFLVKSLHRQ